jgi:hypothetical protein
VSALPFHCARCANRWNGYDTAHCGACHETFTTWRAFDMHRKDSHADDTRHCVPAASVGLVKADRVYPCWRRPGTPPNHHRNLNVTTEDATPNREPPAAPDWPGHHWVGLGAGFGCL